MQVTTIGFDLSKNVFRVHGVAENGAANICKRLRRAQVLATILLSAWRPARARIIGLGNS